MAPLRWGFLGAGLISNDFAAAIESLPRSEHQLTAIGARDLSKAKDFAKKFRFERAYGSYLEVATDPEIDIVYIGTVNPHHYEQCKLMLEHNKHVLCEKPLTLLLEHTDELLRIAKEKKLFFSEAIWSRFFPTYKQLRKEYQAGTVGDVNLITALFAVNIGHVERVTKKELGGGSLVDIGVYTLQFALAVYGAEMPETIKAVGIVNDEGCDLALSISLQYKNGKIAQLNTTTLAAAPSEANVYGSKGNMKLVHPFWCPTELVVNGKSVLYPLPQLNHKVEYGNSEGLVYEAQEVYRCIQVGLTESPHLTHEESLTISRIMDEIKRQVGVSYDDLYKSR